MSIFNPRNDSYKPKRFTDFNNDFGDIAEDPSHEVSRDQNNHILFDPSDEAKKLVTAWKKIEKEAESIKNKATNKKGTPSIQKNTLSKPAVRSSLQGPKNKKDIDALIKDNIGITGKSLASKDATKAAQRPISRGAPTTTTTTTANKNLGVENAPPNRTKVYENKHEELKKMSNKPIEGNSRKSSYALESGRDSQSLNYSDSMSFVDFERELASRASLPTVEKELNTKQAELNPGLMAFLERAREATMLTLDEAKELYEKLKMQGELDIEENGLPDERVPFREIEITNENIDLGNIKPTDKEQRRADLAERSQLQKVREDERRRQETLATLEKNQQEAKRTLYTYKLDKFCGRLESIFSSLERRYKDMAIQGLEDAAKEDRKKCERVDMLKRLQLQSACFCVWTMHVKNAKLERCQKKLQTKKDDDEIHMKKAEDFYRHKLLRKYFNRGFTKHYIKTKQQKDVKKSQNRMKAAIDNFLTKLQPQINEKDSQAIGSYAKQLTDDILAVPVDYQAKDGDSFHSGDPETHSGHGSQKKGDYDIERLTRLPDVYDGKIRADEGSPEEDKNEAEFHQREAKTGASSKSKSAKPMTIEEKAKLRKANAELIKKKHEEQRLKKEEEAKEARRKEEEEIKKRKIDEKKALERKRQEEAEAIERKHKEQEDQTRKQNMASEFRRTWLLRLYGMEAARRISRRNKARSHLADKVKNTQLTKVSFTAWCQGVRILQSEADEMLAPRMREAENKFAADTRRKIFNVLLQDYKKRQDQDSRYSHFREETLTKSCFKKWKKSLYALRKENMIIAEKYDQQIKQLLFRKLIKKGFRGLKDNVNEQVKEKIKKNHKEVMWNKVSGWLNEYKAKKEKDDSD